MATLLSVNVGLPRDVEWEGRTVHTGIWKRPVSGPQTVRRLNIDGDGQGDLGGHGGEQRAVLVYQRASYEHWRAELGRDDLVPGNFGENFTVDGLPDDEVCIGDRYRIGTTEFEVTQPRVTCFRVGLRLGEPRMPALLVAHRRPGFYLRVISEGLVNAGDDITLVRRGPHALSVADIDALLYLPDRDVDQLRAAVDIPALSPGWQQSLRELLDAAETGTPSAAPPIGVEPGWPGFRELQVVDIVRETSSVTSVYLAGTDGTRLPAPRPGQYLTLRAPVAADAPAAVRSYSLSADPDGEAYRISVKREARGLVSPWVGTHLSAGVRVEAAAPRGDFVLVDEAGPVVLVSAGIGVTPVLAMLHRLADQASPRPVWWLHTTRNAAEHAFADEARDLLARLPDAHARIFYTRPSEPSADAAVASGRLDAAALAALDLPTDGTVYICGPEAFMDATRTALVDLGFADARIHTELFGALAAINPGVVGTTHVPPHPPTGMAPSGPQITFARSGLTVRAGDPPDSLLELAEACDVPTRWSCRTGVCHTCVTPLLSGTVRYDPEPLEPAGPDDVLLCCARAETDLVLDL